MYRLIIILGLSLVLLTGCDKGETITCNLEGKEAVFILKAGIVKEYTLAGEKQNKSAIDEINGEYFTSAINNEEGKEALNTYVHIFNGSCD